MFHSILSIFGKDVIDTVFLLITFADVGDLPLLEAAKAAGIPYKDHFKFNNSALFASNISSGAQFNSSEIEQEEKVIKQHEAEIAENKDFTYTLEVAKFRKIPRPSAVTTTCLQCNFTCDELCTYSNSEKAKCCAMDGNGYCTVCPGKCTWQIHANLPYIFEQYTETETRTYQNLKERYETAQTGKEQANAMKVKKEEALLQALVQGDPKDKSWWQYWRK